MNSSFITSRPGLYLEWTGNRPNSRIIPRGAVVVTYLWCVMIFARVYQFACMLYDLVNNLSVMLGGLPVSLG